MTDSIDVSGAWRGSYEQGGSQHGISMRVVHKGQSIVGSMRDDDTLLIGASEDELADLREIVQTGGDQHPEIVTTLPESSVIEGDVVGGTVTFVKRYQGVHRASLWIAGSAVDIETPDHCVQYRGLLEQGGAVIRGRWRIPPFDGDGEEATGAFELRRQ